MGHIYGQRHVEVALFKKQNNTFFKIAHVFLSRVIKQRLSMFFQVFNAEGSMFGRSVDTTRRGSARSTA